MAKGGSCGDPSTVGPWPAATHASEPQPSALSLWRDRATVEAAAALPWSNGQTEGQADRLKLVKRTMYGRAAFALLRRRVLAA